MTTFLKATCYGAAVGLFLGAIIFLAPYFGRLIGTNVEYDEHGYAAIAAILLCVVMGSLSGLVAGLGAYLKRVSEAEDD